jgi:hypothetical protein
VIADAADTLCPSKQQQELGLLPNSRHLRAVDGSTRDKGTPSKTRIRPLSHMSHRQRATLQSGYHLKPSFMSIHQPLYIQTALLHPRVRRCMPLIHKCYLMRRRFLCFPIPSSSFIQERLPNLCSFSDQKRKKKSQGGAGVSAACALTLDLPHSSASRRCRDRWPENQPLCTFRNDITGLSEERPLFFTAGKPYRHQKICQCGIIPFTYYLLRTQAHGTLLACDYVS